MSKVNGQVKVIEQQLPHSLDAERAVLGGVLIDNEAYYDVSGFLEPEHFYSVTHGQIYKAMSDLLREGRPIDLLILTELMAARGHNDAAGLIDLLNAVPTSINTEHYGRVVHASSLRRRMIRAGGQIATAAWDESKAIDGIIEEAERTLFDVTETAVTKGPQAAKEGFSQLFDFTHEMHENGGQMVGLPTGFTDLDYLLEGMKKSDLYVLAARPGMGKSALEGAISLHVASKHRKRVLRFSLEMPAVQSWQRLVAMETGIELTRLRRGAMEADEMKIFDEAIGRLSGLQMWIDDSTDLSPTKLNAKCRRLYAEHGIDLITVDYLQLMTGDGRAQNRTQEVGEISRALKRLARNLDIPVLALAQLSRATEQRGDKRPMLSDLRESGDIENDADVVMFIYRDDYYKPDTSETPNTAEVTVAKHRNGPTGMAELHFDKRRVRFGNRQWPTR